MLGGALPVGRRAAELSRDIHGRIVQAASGCDPFDAVFVDARLPGKFPSERYPRMVAELQAVRGRLAPDPGTKT